MTKLQIIKKFFEKLPKILILIINDIGKYQ